MSYSKRLGMIASMSLSYIQFVLTIMFSIQILLLEAAERASPSDNDLPMTRTTATWYDDVVPDAIPLANPGTAPRKPMGPVGEQIASCSLPGHLIFIKMGNAMYFLIGQFCLFSALNLWFIISIK